MPFERETHFYLNIFVAFVAGLIFSGCGGGAGNGSGSATTTYTVGGSVSGLSGTVVLQNNNGDDLSLNSNGNFTFVTAVAQGAAYSVSVKTQPAGQSCTVGSGSGTVSGNISTVSVSCTQVAWAGVKQLGVTGIAIGAKAVATDASGNVFIVGNTQAGLDGNPLMATGLGNGDLYVTQYDSLGIKKWTRELGAAAGNTFGYAVATDASGNVYVAGSTTGGLDGNTLTGIYDFYVTKYDGNGVKQYTKQLGVAGKNTFGFSVATDASGNVYVAGYTTGGLDGNTLTGSWDFFVTQYNSNAVKQWTTQIGVAGGATIANSVAVDAGGNVVVAGYTTGALPGNSQTGANDIFVAQLSNTGATKWIKQMGMPGTTSARANSVVTDMNGNIYVGGRTTAALNGNTQTGPIDFFVAKYGSDGVLAWLKQSGAAGALTNGRSVVVDAAGDVLVAGDTTGGLDGNTLVGVQDVFLAKFNNNGTQHSLLQFGAAGATLYGNSVASDASSNTFVAGETDGALNANTMNGLSDAFVAKYNSGGVQQ